MGYNTSLYKVMALAVLGTALTACAAEPRLAYDDPWAGPGASRQHPGTLPPVRQPRVKQAAVEPQAGADWTAEQGGQGGEQSYSEIPTYDAPVDAAPAARLPDQNAEVMRMRERLERVERAMLRLDRRMQLVERNELGRMNGGDGQMSQLEGGETLALLNGVEPAGGAPLGREAAGGFQSVSAEADAAMPEITSTLQAAPRGRAGFQRVNEAPRQVASVGLPSLADRSGGGTSAASSMPIWTVRYAEAKVWPAREQLPGSREVVDALRQPAPVVVYARGARPNSVAFRDRVKALSRYLAKVSGQETVAIAALEAPHLDADTIEIFATPANAVAR
jgi:hypothetical protein